MAATADNADHIPEFDLVGFLPYRLAEAADVLSRDLARLYRKEAHINTAQWRVLAHLAYSGSVSVRDIHRRVSMEKSRVSRAAVRLEQAGFIEKHQDKTDGRLVSLSLTRKGRALMARLVPLAIDYQRRVETLLGDHLGSFHCSIEAILRSAEPRGETEEDEP